MNSLNDGEHTRKGIGRVTAALVIACFALLAVAAPSAIGAQQVITSVGPLNNIFLNDNLACNANHTGDTAPEFFGGTDPGACGTFIHTGETVYGPDVPAGNPRTPYDLVSQSAVTGAGTSGNPFQVVTVVDVGETGLRITQTDSYVVGDEFYRTDIVVSNSTGSNIAAALYHAGDCFLQESDDGNGFFDSSGGGIYCSTNANNVPPDRIEGFVPLSSGSNYVEIDWPTIWDIIDGTQFPNTCECTTFQDNGAGLSWSLAVPANGSVTRSLLTAFSPTGETPPQGKISARGTVQTVQGPAIGFSAATNCNPSLSTRPSIVGTTAGAAIWTKGTVTQSSCTDEPPASPLGFDAQTGTATGTFGPAAPGGLNGQQGTLEWFYSDATPDTVQFTLRDSSSNIVFDMAEQTPSSLRGSPGGVWTFAP